MVVERTRITSVVVVAFVDVVVGGGVDVVDALAFDVDHATAARLACALEAYGTSFIVH